MDAPGEDLPRHDREDQAIVVSKIGLCNALHVLSCNVHKDVELAISRGDVVMNDCGMRKMHRLLLIRGPSENVVTSELVLNTF